jgi:hypothetical protein
VWARHQDALTIIRNVISTSITGGGLEYLTVAMLVVRGDRGNPVPGGYKYGDLALRWSRSWLDVTRPLPGTWPVTQTAASITRGLRDCRLPRIGRHCEEGKFGSPAEELPAGTWIFIAYRLSLVRSLGSQQLRLPSSRVFACLASFNRTTLWPF